MLIFDFFAGLGSSTQAFRDAGDTVISFEINRSMDADDRSDLLITNGQELVKKYGRPDFIWASPPCTSFSVASVSNHWKNEDGEYVPLSESASYGRLLAMRTIELMYEIDPKVGFAIENPRGLLRKMPFMQDMERVTVHYCQYGDNRQKPTDIWGVIPNWIPRPVCSPGASCHEAAPRGTHGGTQGMNSAKERSAVPSEIGKEIREALIWDL
jgi:site-specific DNA-cytosine methylase